MRDFTLPRSRGGDQVDKLLGKRGTPLDRHSLASEDLFGRLSSARQRLAAKHCSWDETLAMMQWVLGGVLNYAPLIGLPAPADAHREDAAFHRLILSGLGVRRTAEHVSLSAPRSSGVSGPAHFRTPCGRSRLRRLVAAQRRRAGCRGSPGHNPAGYGLPSARGPRSCWAPLQRPPLPCRLWPLYLSLSTDRFVSRLLDNLHPPEPQSLAGPFSQARFDAAARFSRVGLLANSVRTAYHAILLLPDPPAQLVIPETWAAHLPAHAPVSAQACARAASAALRQSRADFEAECRLFAVPCPPHPPSEDWLPAARSPRSSHLLQRAAIPAGDFALFGDGSFTSSHGATFACQARGFGPSNDYWGSASWVYCQFRGRLPARLGWAHSSIHTAELLSLVVALRFRQPGHWHLLAFDRSSLFDILVMVDRGVTQDLLTSPGLPLVCHLRRLLGELADSWKDPPPQPAWRLQQEQAPSLWPAIRLTPPIPVPLWYRVMRCKMRAAVRLVCSQLFRTSLSPVEARLRGSPSTAAC